MTVPEVYILVGGMFSVAYGFGWDLEQRALTKRIAKHKTATRDFILSPSGRALIKSPRLDVEEITEDTAMT